MPDNQKNKQPGAEGQVTADELIAALRAERYRVQLERPNTFPTEQNWQYIISRSMDSIAPQLYKKYLLSWLTDKALRTDFHRMAMKYFPEYLRAIDRRVALSAVYGDIRSCPEATLHIIDECRLFDASYLQEILEDDNAETDPAPFVADCLSAFQPDYTDSDLQNMRGLYRALTSLAPVGSVHENRGIFGREQRYVCPAGHINPGDTEFCLTCGVNKYGFNEKQAANIEELKQRIKLLERLLAKR